jgi:hypothetical protein
MASEYEAIGHISKLANLVSGIAKEKEAAVRRGTGIGTTSRNIRPMAVAIYRAAPAPRAGIEKAVINPRIGDIPAHSNSRTASDSLEDAKRRKNASARITVARCRF